MEPGGVQDRLRAVYEAKLAEVLSPLFRRNACVFRNLAGYAVISGPPMCDRKFTSCVRVASRCSMPVIAGAGIDA